MIISVVIIISAIFVNFAVSDILVNLPDGSIRGKESVTLKNKSYFSFLKVPYASPPIGNLRFKAPIPPKKWNTVLNTTNNSAECYQVAEDSSKETEDCLYLNIYTPQLPSKKRNISFPVMLYIFGGGFVTGTSLPHLYGPDFFIDHDVIIVTVSYRLGPFGFLSTGDRVIPGNNGLKDQLLAIKWTHDNINLFSGDPEKIIIFGQSAGSSSVSYQLLHPDSKGLFRGAILESGSALCPWSLIKNPRDIAFKTAGLINSTLNHNNNSEDLHNFLLRVSADTLDKASAKLFNMPEQNILVTQGQGFTYGPVLEPVHDGAFITNKMHNLMKSGDFIKMPVMIGMTSEEGLYFVSGLPPNAFEIYDKNVSLLVPFGMNIKNTKKLKTVGAIIHRMYTNTTFKSNFASGVRHFSDNLFTRSIIKHAEMQSKFAKVYFYQFSYKGVLGHLRMPVKGLKNGVAHTEEIPYLWHISSFKGFNNTDIKSFPEADITTHYRLLKMWTDFAKTLNPTPKKSHLLQNIIWPLVNSRKPTDFLYLDINVNLKIMNHPKEETYTTWNNLFKTFGEGEYDTY